MALPNAPGGTTRAQQIAYYASYLAKIPGTYEGKLTQYYGQTWAELYENIANANPQDNPKELAGAVVILEGAQRLGSGTAAAEAGLGSFLGTGEKAVANTNFAAGVPVPLTGLNAIGAFFSDLGNAKVWERIAEGILAILLIATAVSHLAGNSKAGQIARKVPLVM